MTRSNVRYMIIMLVVAGAIGSGVVGFHAFGARMAAKAIQGRANPAQTVSTAIATKSLWQPTVQALGTLVASQQSDLTGEVGGLVTAIHFHSGQKVRKGEPLVELNTAPLEAQLAQLQAKVALAQVNLERDEGQLEVNAVSQAQVDTDKATLKSLQAGIEAQKALIAQKVISAPYSGQVGIRQVNLGQFLAAGKPIVTLQKLDPMNVDFTVPQNQVVDARVGMKVQIQTTAAPGRTFDAKVTAIEPQIDKATRNLELRARVPNHDGALLPGAFATVTLDEGPPHEYVTIPNAAVAYNPYGATVFVVKDNGEGPDGKPRLTVEQRFITTGATRGDQVAVIKGIDAGETVVTAGQVKLRNGSRIVVNNSVRPTSEANPRVPNS